ncbi:MAG: hypothetical protein KTR29_19345, partial [Rhodothermaceae bacterium]|nr:hypothetical protein [Rhodothermaceae bacterium]
TSSRTPLTEIRVGSGKSVGLNIGISYSFFCIHFNVPKSYRACGENGWSPSFFAQNGLPYIERLIELIQRLLKARVVVKIVLLQTYDIATFAVEAFVLDGFVCCYLVFSSFYLPWDSSHVIHLR